MKIIGIAIVGVVLLLLLLMDKSNIKKMIENLSVFWFRLAFAFLALFILNIAGGFVGIYFPVNIASGFLLAILGIPGFAALFTFAVFL
ncbi:pro-sigmaK processing inhibitor BofA family protein [Sporosarcina thermotolerans]|uniref:Pro-sigmaK processing inhibitor BofA family protein n=1 Tax=Sporosarcina thermotolerans TaxID=633404 RepID=A0AAW9ACU1_9BACL|nr:pro-sigmaK processing inhibitor BofA family protein [Sporosarcina thermotolerans]MDW0118854.1 pro-sigmaK processing inhibitor BofA family protein [Sporosarcina thermotolerans]WHT48685.1 pro-sigmaK processing inhibitor BofA family protein [Sporosarcina thermotolerans]